MIPLTLWFHPVVLHVATNGIMLLCFLFGGLGLDSDSSIFCSFGNCYPINMFATGQRYAIYTLKPKTAIHDRSYPNSPSIENSGPCVAEFGHA